jgi:DNA repair protein RadC
MLFKSIIAESLNEPTDSFIVKEIASQFSTPQQLLDISEHELLQIPGIGKAKSRQIISAIKLAKIMNLAKCDVHVIRSPKDVFDLFRYEIGFENKEHFVVLSLSTKNHVIGKDVISIGNLNSAIVTPREVYRAAIKRAACSIICIHNHPAQICSEPSPEDVNISQRLKKCGEIIGLDMLDSIVLTGSEYTSLKERGLL